MTRRNHAHMYSDQGYSSVFVNWTKQACLQPRLRWWQWWGAPEIIWNRVPDRRRSKRKWTITKCCLTVCRSIEKRHGVWAGSSVAGVQWLYMQHVIDIWWCSTAVAVVAQTSYFVSASYFDRKRWSPPDVLHLSTDFSCRHPRQPTGYDSLTQEKCPGAGWETLTL